MDKCKINVKKQLSGNKYNFLPFNCGIIYCVDFMEFAFYCTLCDDKSTSSKAMSFKDYTRHFQNHLDIMNGENIVVEETDEILNSENEEPEETCNNLVEETDIIAYDESDCILINEANETYKINHCSNLNSFVDPLQTSSDIDENDKEDCEKIFFTINKKDNQEDIFKLSNYEPTDDESKIDEEVSLHANSNERNVKRKTRQSQYICDACGKILQSRYKLKVHMRSHTGKNPYSCDQCGKSYRYAQNLNRHLMLHQNAKPYKCQYCHKSYSSKDALQNHETLHTGAEKKYKCTLCEKSFGVPAYLEIHMRKHTGERPYECEICHARFVSKVNLIKKHQPCPELKFKCDVCNRQFLTEKEYLLCTHSTLNNTKPVVYNWNCDKCTNSFKSCQALKVHIKIHNHPYKCKGCNKGFPNENSLKKHVEYYHNRQRPFVCDICQSTFLTAVGLRKHKVRHSNIKAYKCLKCDKAFINSEGLNCHRRVHTDRVQCKTCGKYLTQLSVRTHKCQKLINNQ